MSGPYRPAEETDLGDRLRPLVLPPTAGAPHFDLEWRQGLLTALQDDPDWARALSAVLEAACRPDEDELPDGEDVPHPVEQLVGSAEFRQVFVREMARKPGWAVGIGIAAFHAVLKDLLEHVECASRNAERLIDRTHRCGCGNCTPEAEPAP